MKMKLFRLQFTLVIVLIAMLIACTKDESASFYRALVDGKDWVSSDVATTRRSSSFFISGNTVKGEVLEITIHGFTPGIYRLSDTLNQVLAVYKKSNNALPQDWFVATEGQVELTEVTDNYISGTFSFELYRSSEDLTINTGEFGNLNYVVQ